MFHPGSQHATRMPHTTKSLGECRGTTSQLSYKCTQVKQPENILFLQTSRPRSGQLTCKPKVSYFSPWQKMHRKLLSLLHRTNVHHPRSAVQTTRRKSVTI